MRIGEKGTIAAWSSYRGGTEGRGWAPDGVDPPLTLRWSTRIGPAVRSSPLVIGDRVCAASIDGRIVLLHAAMGGKRGQRSLRTKVIATPALSDGWLFIASTGKKGGSWMALDLVHGKLAWRVKGGGSSAPLVMSDRVIVGNDRGHLLALEKDTGAEIWRFETKGRIWSSPSSDQDGIYVGCDGDRVYRLSGQGISVWECDVKGSVYGSIAVSEAEIYVVTTSGWVYQLDRETGSIAWSSLKEETGFYAGPAIDEAMLYVGGTDRVLYALDRATGEEQWTFTAAGVIRSAPVVTGNTVYFGCGDRLLYALDKGTGALLWSYKTGGAIVSSPAATDQGVYVGAMDGTVYGFAPQRE